MTTTAEEFKAAGNTAFQAGDFKAAIDHYTRAIDLDGTNHVYYSNRSAAYFKQYYAATSCTDDRSDSYIDLWHFTFLSDRSIIHLKETIVFKEIISYHRVILNSLKSLIWYLFDMTSR